MGVFTFPTLGDTNDERLCFVSTVPREIERYDFRLRFGERLADVYPKDAKIFLSKEYPGVKLVSQIGNTKGMIAAAPEMVEAIRKHCEGVAIEYLPFTIIDHRKRVLSDAYAIVNPLGTFDAVNESKSNIQLNARGKVVRIHHLVLDAKKLEKAPALFRLDKGPSVYVVSQALADEFRKRQLTNVLLEEMEVG
jgi:hypothetical protein